jgi:hypothetical protein
MLSKGTIQPTRRLRPQTSFRSAKIGPAPGSAGSHAEDAKPRNEVWGLFVAILSPANKAPSAPRPRLRQSAGRRSSNSLSRDRRTAGAGNKRASLEVASPARPSVSQALADARRRENVRETKSPRKGRSGARPRTYPLLWRRRRKDLDGQAGRQLLSELDLQRR